MSERDAFIRQICENPADDVARLVFADWLGENGEEERGNFIRLQIALSYRDPQYTLDTSMNHKVYEKSAIPEVRAAYDALRNFSARDVMEKRPSLLPMSLWGNVIWKRGFISHVRQYCAEFMKDACDLFTWHPIEGVTLADDNLRPWNSGNYRWGWSNQTADCVNLGPNWILPRELFVLLPTEKCVHNINENRRWWDNQQGAFDALSQACVRYGRKLAKLPPLPIPTPVA